MKPFLRWIIQILIISLQTFFLKAEFNLRSEYLSRCHFASFPLCSVPSARCYWIHFVTFNCKSFCFVWHLVDFLLFTILSPWWHKQANRVTCFFLYHRVEPWERYERCLSLFPLLLPPVYFHGAFKVNSKKFPRLKWNFLSLTFRRISP